MPRTLTSEGRPPVSGFAVFEQLNRIWPREPIQPKNGMDVKVYFTYFRGRQSVMDATGCIVVPRGCTYDPEYGGSITFAKVDQRLDTSRWYNAEFTLRNIRDVYAVINGKERYVVRNGRLCSPT